MQKLAPLWFGVFAVWCGFAAAQAQDYIIQQNNATAKSRPVPHHVASAPVAPSVVRPAKHAKPRVVMLLPTLSPSLGGAAAVVKAGVEAAAKVDDAAELSLVATHDDDVARQYREAVGRGAQVVIGPLTREAIAAVAPRITVPTLALNTLEPETGANFRLLGLSLSVESEARQLARLMREDGRAKPLLLATSDAISRRMARAFAEEWQRQTRNLPLQAEWSAAEPPGEAVQQADSVFLALTHAQAAAAKAALPGALAVYATSQVNERTSDARLNGVHFIDMPWLLMPDHPAVRRYPRPESALTMQTERLYALGVDAYRVALAMAAKLPPPGWQLSGVTGDLKLLRDRQFARELPAARIGEGAF
jgi:hypothetical protein